MPEATWKPHEKHGQLTTQSYLPDSVYAFPKQRKEPLTDAEHVHNAVARFDQVIDVSDADRALAFANIEKAAKYYNVNLAETSLARPGRTPSRKQKRGCRQRRCDTRTQGAELRIHWSRWRSDRLWIPTSRHFGWKNPMDICEVGECYAQRKIHSIRLAM
jgi:hypothetical protein